MPVECLDHQAGSESLEASPGRPTKERGYAINHLFRLTRGFASNGRNGVRAVYW
jgi:hypothetical protein